MKKACLFGNIFLIYFITSLITSCHGQEQGETPENTPSKSTYTVLKTNTVNDGIADAILCGLSDKENKLWFGTLKEGLYYYDGKSFTNFNKEDGLNSNRIISIVEEKNGNLWLGTGNGLCKYDGNVFTPIPIPEDGKKDLWGEGCNANQVLCLMQDKKGNIWLGTCGGGAYCYDGKTFTSYLSNEGRIQSDGLHHNVIRSITEDNAGNIWFTSATHGGVSKYDGTNFTHYNQKDGLSDDMIISSMMDSKGNIWFGALGNRAGCLSLYDGKTFTNFNEKDGLCNNNVSRIFEDKKGTIWLGSNRGGLCYYNHETFTPFTTQTGEKLQNIKTIIEDKAGNLWFGCNQGGLWRYDGETLTQFIKNR